MDGVGDFACVCGAKEMDKSECVHHLKHKTLVLISGMMLYIFLISSVLTESMEMWTENDALRYPDAGYTIDNVDLTKQIVIWCVHPVKNTSEILRNIPGRVLKPVLALLFDFRSLVCCLGLFLIQHCSLVYFQAHAFYFVRFLQDLFSQKAKDGKKRPALSF